MILLISKAINIINENKNKDYIFEIDINKTLKNQQLLEETRAILFNLYRDYLCTKEQREKIKKYQLKELYKKE